MDYNEYYRAIIAGNAGVSTKEFLQREINAFKASKRYKDIVTGRKYYAGEHDVLKKTRTIIDEHGNVIPLTNVPNNRIVNNRFDDLVDQKVNYLLANSIEVRGIDGIENMFSRSWQRKIKYVGMDAYIGGCGFLHPYINGNGELKFKRMLPEHILPFWADEEHEDIAAFVYMYDVEVYDRLHGKKTITKVEFYTPNGISYWQWYNNQLTPDDKPNSAYYTVDEVPYNWSMVPLIPFKANCIEQPLINRVKSLQDALNTIISNFQDCMEEDVRSTVLVVKNYDGTDLSTFKRNLATYGVIKVRDRDGSGGGVDKLTIDVNPSNYELIIKLLKDAIIENGRGFDTKDDRMGNAPNQMNIRSMYSDIDLDANEMELEFQTAFEKMMLFVAEYLQISGKALNETAEFIFNRNLPINEADVINCCQNSVGILSRETIIANHPWTVNTDDELARIKAEEMQYIQDYALGGGADDVLG